MARELEISEEAIGDLSDIWDYIAKDGLSNADQFIEQLHRKCLDIAELHGIGRVRDDLFPGLFSIPHKKYIIFLERNEAQVLIARILHGSCDLGRIFEN